MMYLEGTPRSEHSVQVVQSHGNEQRPRGPGWDVGEHVGCDHAGDDQVALRACASAGGITVPVLLRMCLAPAALCRLQHMG